MLNKLKRTLYRLLSGKISAATPLGELGGEVVFLTGGGKGIGKAIIEYLHAEGCKCVVFSRNMQELKNAFPESRYSDVLLLEGSVADTAAAKHAIEDAISRYGHIDVLINNAGTFLEKPLEQTSEADMNNIIDSNIKGAVNFCSAILPYMKANNRGTIINIGSKISHNTNVSPNKVLYATTKYAIEGLSFALNKELKGTGVRVVCLMPGTVNTFLSKDFASYLSPIRVAQVVAMVMKMEDVDFEGIVFKSINQNI